MKTWDELVREPISVLFGKAVREARKSRGMTQAALADRACTEQGWISRLENGKIEMANLVSLLYVVELLDIDVRYLNTPTVHLGGKL